MEWELVFKSWNRIYKLKAKIIETSPTHEKIKVIGKKRSIVLQNDRPFFISRRLRHRRWDWQQIEGDKINVRHFNEDLIQELEKHLRGL